MAKIKGYTMPDDLYYHQNHTWVRLENDGTATVGMTEFYSRMAGDTTYVDLPEEDDDIEQGDTAGKIQSSKWVGKLVAPISGTIVEINENLEDDFMLLNTDPYGDGWIMRIEPSNLDEDLANLFHERDDVEKFLEREIVTAEGGGDAE
ncbi:glycine cleavage system protein GcvH [bacterium]|nr:glycine cleavage system protein GcvH [candidate division CSSED10-310 bacterium]